LITYKEAGVNIGANTRWVHAIQAAMKRTYGPRVCKHRHGGFAGLFRLDFDEQLLRRNYRRPVLVGCTDGVGTKVLIAIEMNQVSTIGIDLVAMNVNDLIACGAEPLFFLDYLAVHTLDPQALLAVIEGVSAGCIEAGCALLGGETAEMPAMYRRGDFDLAGFAVGVVEQGRVVDGTRVTAGDVLVGLPSSGVHSNGYSLVRAVLARGRCKLDREYGLGEPLGEALLRPTRIYVRAVQAVFRKYRTKRVIKAMAHITGGGLRENIARVLPEDCDAVIHRNSWTPPAIFGFLKDQGIGRAEMFRVFNMGIGFVLAVSPHYANGVMATLERVGERPVQIGVVTKGRQRVQLR